MLESAASHSKSGRADNAWSQLSTVPAYPSDPASEEALFAAVEKLVRAAGVSARQHNLTNAASALRRAYFVASKKAEAGLLAGRVARASVAVQYCALLSRFDRHTLALKEALAAAREAEEVWSILMQAALARDNAYKRGEVSLPEKSPFGMLLRDPPEWLHRAVSVLVQAKQCVAIELEYSIREPDAARQHPEEIETVRDQLVPSLHREAAELATQLLPEDHPVRLLSERTQAQAMVRRHDPPPPLMRGWTRPSTPASRGGAQKEQFAPWEGALASMEQAMSRPVPPELASPLGAPEVVQAGWMSPANDALDTCGAPSPSEPGGPGGSRPGSAVSRAISAHNSRPTSAHMSRPGSAARLHQLEDQALLRPADGQWPEEVQDVDDLRFADVQLALPNWIDSEARAGQRSPGSGAGEGGGLARRSSTGSKGTDGKEKTKSKTAQRNGNEEGPKDVFAEWVQGNFPKGRQGKVFTRIKSEAGIQELKMEMKRESHKLRNEELPFMSPEVIYDNKVLYSQCGMKVHQQAMRQSNPEKALMGGSRPSSHQGRRSHKKLHEKMMQSVKGWKSELQDSTEDLGPRFSQFVQMRGMPTDRMSFRPSLMTTLKEAFHQKAKGGQHA